MLGNGTDRGLDVLPRSAAFRLRALLVATARPATRAGRLTRSTRSPCTPTVSMTASNCFDSGSRPAVGRTLLSGTPSPSVTDEVKLGLEIAARASQRHTRRGATAGWPGSRPPCPGLLRVAWRARRRAASTQKADQSTGSSRSRSRGAWPRPGRVCRLGRQRVKRWYASSPGAEKRRSGRSRQAAPVFMIDIHRVKHRAMVAPLAAFTARSSSPRSAMRAHWAIGEGMSAGHGSRERCRPTTHQLVQLRPTPHSPDSA